MAIYRDDRTEKQRRTHTVLIAGTDKVLSGWGLAANGTSYAAWACRPQDAYKVERWVRQRSDMLRVRVVSDPWRPCRRPGDNAHIYVVTDNHPALTD